jgi:hypothetical protein
VSLRRVSVAGAIVIVAATVGTLLARQLLGGGERASLTVTVAGRSAHVVEGTTLAGAAARFRLHLRAGDVLDVNGKVLRAGAVPGRFLIDGRPASAGMRLRSGDRITVVDGQDRRESLVRRSVRVSGGMPSDPQFTVSRTPGEQVIVRGALSDELVSVRFRPSGPARVERAVALTFDDGPSPQYTPRILAALTKLRVRATFFVIGYLAEANPDLVRQELRLGMTVGNPPTTIRRCRRSRSSRRGFSAMRSRSATRFCPDSGPKRDCSGRPAAAPPLSLSVPRRDSASGLCSGRLTRWTGAPTAPQSRSPSVSSQPCGPARS